MAYVSPGGRKKKKNKDPTSYFIRLRTGGRLGQEQASGRKLKGPENDTSAGKRGSAKGD